MGSTEYLKDDEEGTGVGVDIFFRKKKPGPRIGVGYIVDVFENGVKIYTEDAKDKKRIKELIEEYKLKYQTHRSFQNESQIHVTYKTKEERGEFPPPPEPKKSEPFGEEAKSEEELAKEKDGRNAMTIETLIQKKANMVQDLLYRLIDPSTPIKKRAETDVASGKVDLGLPQTALPGESPDSAVSEDDIAKQMATKLVEYAQEKAQSPVDDLYNGIKHWMSSVRKVLTDYDKLQKSSGQESSIDRTSISTKVKEIVTSGDINKIQEATGIAVEQNVADILQKVTLMDAGTPKKDKSPTDSSSDKTDKPAVKEVESPNLAEAAEKTASIDGNAEKILEKVHAAPESESVNEAVSSIKKLIGSDEADLAELAESLPENFAGKAVEKAIKQIEKELDGKDTGNSLKAVEVRVKEFFEYSARSQKRATLENTFEAWANIAKLSIGEAQPIWNAVKESVHSAFRKYKEAGLLFGEGCGRSIPAIIVLW